MKILQLANLLLLLDKIANLYYIVYVIQYEKSIQKSLKKGDISKKQFELFHHAFQSLDLTKNLNLFDIKQLKGNFTKDYFRLRKGKYRAIFYIENNDFYVIHIAKRDEVYNLWE